MVFGLLGEKLGHSYSPQIHRYLGNYSYDLFQKSPENLKSFLESKDFQGLNVTIPYKKTVIPYCRKLSPEAQKLGAVNTIVRCDDGTLMGHNTDYFGFQSMAKRVRIDYCEKKVLILGSGGASNTVRVVIEEMGAIPIVISRNGENNYHNLHRHNDCAVIVNATPVGMYPSTGVSPVDLRQFPKLEAVLDLIYNPSQTKLLMDAQALGCQTENGLWMLIAQAKESAEWFTGKAIYDNVIAQIYPKLKLQMENIILVGMPGCGKSTVGRLLAEKLNKTFVDADAEIEKAAGCSIPEIFQNQKEDGFRKIETNVLQDLGKRSSLVIATGGGCVTRPENLPFLQQNGTIIWLKRDISALPTDGRPLSQNSNLQKMYEIRKPMYELFSDFSVSNDSTPENAAEAILRQLEVTL